MAKTIIVAIVALSLGAATGVIAGQYSVREDVEGFRGQYLESEQKLVDAQQALNSMERQAERLARQNAHLETRLEALRETEEVEAAEVDRPEGEAGDQQAAIDWRDAIRDRLEGQNGEGLEEQIEQRIRDRMRGELGTRLREGLGVVEERLQDGIRQHMYEEFRAAGDSASEERIAVMMDYGEYIMDLREQMREAEGQEREALREEMGEAGGIMRDLVEEQQEHSLRMVAEEHGVTDPEQQRSLIESFEEAQANAIFSPRSIIGMIAGGGDS